MKELTVPAAVDALASVRAFIEAELEAHDCPPGVLMWMTLAVEELFVNIARYAYPPARGEATVRCAVRADETPPQAVIQFLDRGRPYNPLDHADPDIDAPAGERGIGGLGIFLVKKTMDAIDYEYRDGRNILTIRKTMVDDNAAARPSAPAAP